MEPELELVCDLSNGADTSDFEWPVAYTVTMFSTSSNSKMVQDTELSLSRIIYRSANFQWPLTTLSNFTFSFRKLGIGLVMFYNDGVVRAVTFA